MFSSSRLLRERISRGYEECDCFAELIKKIYKFEAVKRFE